jgi:DNA-binding CsgD family transcriptional regulator
MGTGTGRGRPVDRDGLELSYQAEGVADRDEYLRAASETLLRLLGGDTVLWNAVRLSDPAVEVVVHPLRGLEAETLARQLSDVLGEHPMMPSYMSDRGPGLPAPRRLSDVATRAELERNRAYVEVLRPSGARHQLTVLASPITLESTRGWAISRSGRDFDDDALEMARALQPMLAVLDRTLSRPAVTDPARLAAADRVGLTARELEVLHLVAAGLTSQAAGRRLRISHRTVDKHRESIYRKLGRHDRLSAVQRAQELGILPLPRSRRHHSHN